MRYLQSGVAVCDFSVAVNETWGSGDDRQEKTTWHKVTAWNKLAETCNQYVTKGMQVLVVGSPSVSAYMGKDGEAKASLELRARDVQFLSRVEEGAGADTTRMPAVDGGQEDIPF